MITISQQKYSSIILNKDINSITEQDIEETKKILNDLIWKENYTPSKIKEKFKINYSDFGMVLKGTFNIKLKTIGESLKNHHYGCNNHLIDEKKKYWNDCKFKFDPYVIPHLEGYHLLTTYNFRRKKSHTVQNNIEMDHMVSILYGWNHSIPPEIISHPANCEIMLDIENHSKNSNCSITIEQLLERIKNWNDSTTSELKKQKIKIPKSKEIKEKISKSIKNKITINNGIKNRIINKQDIIPNGYRVGHLANVEGSSGRKSFITKINDQRKSMGFIPLTEKQQDSIISSSIWIEKVKFNLLLPNLDSEIKRVQQYLIDNQILSIRNLLLHFNIAVSKHLTKRKFDNFLSI